MSANWRLGIDVGGTFNDLVAVREGDGLRIDYKQPSVPADPSKAVEAGLRGLMEKAGVVPGQVSRIMHGTTLALNTILQRRGARLAMVVSRGNGDVLEIARSRVASAFDFTLKRETPLIPRNRVYEIDARIMADGCIDARPDAAALDALAERIAATRVDAVAVMLLNSYRHPELEAEVAQAIRQRLPGLAVTASAAVWPELREYERAMLAALNAYVQPLMESYLDRLAQRLAALGLTAPLFITTNNGGSVALASARARPIEAALSGPSSGVTAAIREAPARLRDRLVTLDMGGTSTDMAVVLDALPEYTNEARIGDFPVILPVVAVTAIGAGGGSQIMIDAQGVMKVGPESAGSDPGPVCYGRGGETPTVTDCYLTTGILAADAFLGGRMPLDAQSAAAALSQLGAGFGIDGAGAGARTAAAALRVATAMMAVELSKLLARRGLDHRDFTLVAFGGAGATHATMLAAEAGLPQVLIPRTPGTFCALGAALADVRRDYARSLAAMLTADGEGYGPIALVLDELVTEASDWARAEADGNGALPLHFQVMAEMRFGDQAHALEVFVPEDQREQLDGPALLELFHQEHARLYGFSSRDDAVRVSTLRVSVSAPSGELPDPPMVMSVSAPPQSRPVFNAGQWVEAEVRRRSGLAAGNVIAGPAIIEQDDTTVWIVPGWSARVEPDGNLLISPDQEDER
ncbi:hydantoinase/oxoprolinase family protein [Paracoccus sp. S-4012]|uniref:hydantoinase/oxoprolinase family protein n=1 Tax=Paracoccus sp. S-4012 TaxID=2665648 RepID=UPI0012AF05D1|nr:hydantoinase/oxoprolinase family protein [Paracoccus sp. S-4012]MRX51626.1 hydantoinase/oxoprolinase family protein [Paracoccus sp. S-4012]